MQFIKIRFLICLPLSFNDYQMYVTNIYANCWHLKQFETLTLHKTSVITWYFKVFLLIAGKWNNLKQKRYCDNLSNSVYRHLAEDKNFPSVCVRPHAFLPVSHLENVFFVRRDSFNPLESYVHPKSLERTQPDKGNCEMYGSHALKRHMSVLRWYTFCSEFVRSLPC